MRDTAAAQAADSASSAQTAPLTVALATADDLLAEVSRLPDIVPQPPTIKKLRYTHEAMIDMIIAEPAISQNELAMRFGYSPSWISTIIASDAFQTRLHARQELIVDPILKLKTKEQLEGLMFRSMELLRNKLNTPNPPDQLVLRTLELTSRAAGYGARTETNVQVNVTQRIEDAGDQLVTLLRRKKAEVSAEEPIDGEIVKG